MRKAITTLTALTAILVAVLAAPAAAEQIVPPGNSAANQYTEAFPTARGEEMQSGDELNAKDVLGARDTKKLEQHGKTGREVAQFAAETAPAPVSSTTSPSAGDTETGSADRGGKQGGNGQGKQGDKADEAATTRGAGGSGSGSGPTAGSGSTSVDQPAGSSGVGEVVSEATGVSAGRLGLWLPLIVIGAAIWAAVYFIRQRQHRVA